MNEWLPLITVLLAGSGIGGLIAILVKSGAERQSIIVGSAEKSLSMQATVIESLRSEIDRRDRLIELLRGENSRLRELLPENS